MMRFNFFNPIEPSGVPTDNDLHGYILLYNKKITRQNVSKLLRLHSYLFNSGEVGDQSEYWPDMDRTGGQFASDQAEINFRKVA